MEKMRENSKKRKIVLKPIKLQAKILKTPKGDTSIPVGSLIQNAKVNIKKFPKDFFSPIIKK